MAQWPNSVATDVNLYVAVNGVFSSLSVALAPADTTIAVGSVTGFPSSGIILVDNELVFYAGILNNTFISCVRAFDGTAATSHNSGVQVSAVIPAAHHNALKDEIKAIEAYLSSNLGTGNQPLSNGHRVLLSNALGKIIEALTTDTEVGFVHGVTSAIQPQIDSKVAKAGDSMTGPLVMGSNKITGLANGTAPQDAAAFGQIPAAIPTGAMLDFGGTSAPSGWLLCDGSVVSQTTYAALFAAIGVTWNTGGEGAGNFRLPDMRRKVGMGSGGTGTGTIGNAVGNTGGEEAHTLTTAELASHSHGITDPGHTTTVLLGQTAGSSNTGLNANLDNGTHNVPGQPMISPTSTTGITVNNAGSGTAHNIIQPAAIVLKIIKT